MRRLAKGSSAQSFDGSGSAGSRLFGRSFATRGGSRGAKGSGAPSGRAPARTAPALAVAFVLALTLVIAPAAQASKGVLGFFGNPTTAAGTTGGLFATPGGTAVNNATGNVYVADRGNNRVQEFNSNGDFLRAWGYDVVQPGGTGDGNGKPLANEQQSVALSTFTGTVSGGTFNLIFNGATTTPTGTGSITEGSNIVTGLTVSAGTFTVGQGIAGAFAAPGIPFGTTITAVNLGEGKLTLSNNAAATVAGESLTAGWTTTPLGYKATPEAVQNALAALPTIGAGNVSVTGPAEGTPWAVTFVGALAQTDVAAIGGNSNLTTTPAGGFSFATSTTTVNGGAPLAFEKCTVASQCKAGTATATDGGMSAPQGIAVNQTTGNVYVTDEKFFRVDEYTESGDFIRSFGQGVVSTGADQASSQQALSVNATGGTFTLTFGAQTTATPIASNAPATTVQGALEGLSSIGIGNVTVSGGPGDATASHPYIVTFAGTLAGKPQALITANSTLLTGGNTHTATIASLNAGETGFEICNANPPSNDVCKTGVAGGIGGAFASTFTGYPTVAPAGAPNAGNLLVADTNNRRVQEFSANGAFIRAFGQRVVATGPDKANAAQAVTVTATGGTFTLTYNAQSTAELDYNASPAAVRGALNALSTIGGIGGKVSVSGGPGNASGSSPYLVTFGGALAGVSVSALTANTSTLSTAIGQTLSCTPGPASAATKTVRWLRNGAPIAGATATTYTLVGADAGAAIQCQSFAINANAGATQIGNPSIVAAPFPETTPPANTLAPVASSAALTVGAAGGAILSCTNGTWNGGPTFSFQWYRNGVALSGNGANTSAYTVQTADLATAAAFQCAVTATNAGGSVSIVSANKTTTAAPSPAAPVATAIVPGPSVTIAADPSATGFEVCTIANGDACQVASAAGSAPGQFSGLSRVAESATGAIYTAETSGNIRVQKFTPAGASLTPSVFAAGILSGTTGNNAVSDIAVDPTNGDVYAVKGNLLGEGTPPAGVANERRVLQLDSSGSLLDTYIAGAAITSANGFALNSSSGRMYLSSTTGAQRVYVLDDVPAPTVVLGPATEVATNSAKLSGSVNPNGSASPAGVTASYHFEVKGGTAASWTRYPAADIDVGAGNAAVPVSITVAGLDAHRFYRYRLVATKSFGGPSEISSEGEFNTSQLAPEVFTTPTYEWGPTSGVLKGAVNPNGLPTTYYFEYGTGTGYGTKLPATGNADAGFGASERDFKVSIFHLQPHTTYHYRIVAHNAIGTSTGDDQSFTTGARPMVPDGVDDRAYELVSMRNSNGVAATYLEAAVDGDHLAYNGFLLPLPGALNPSDAVEASRTSSGWTQEHIAPPVPAGVIVGAENGSGAFFGLGDDNGETALFQTNESLFPGDQNFAPDKVFVSGTDLYQRHPDGSFTWVSEPPVLPSTIDPGINYQGRSADGSHILFSANGGHLLPQDTHASNSGLYELDHGTLRFVSFQPDGSVLASGAEFGAGGLQDEKGAHTVISADGSRIFFTAGSDASGPGSPQVYVREDHTSTVLASASQRTPPDATRRPAEFAAASTDGSKVFFMSSEQLTNDAKTGPAGAGKDIYEFNVDDGTLHDLSVDTTPGDANGAAVQGWAGISDDGSHVYFVANGVLAPGATPGNCSGSVPTAGLTCNLYVYRDGAVKFIAKVAGKDSPLWAHSWNQYNGVVASSAPSVSPGSGRYMLFTSTQELVPGEQTGDMSQPWLYDSVSESLKCLVCAPLGGGPPTHEAGPASPKNQEKLTADGRALFSSADAFVPGDVNGTEDVYEYEGGQLHLISGGVSKVRSVVTGGFSANGRDVFFQSPDALTPDALAGAVKIYTARTGGGFPLAEDPPEPVLCSGEACQGKPTPPPADATPGTTSIHAPEPVPVPDCTAPKQKLLGAKKMLSHAKKTLSHSQGKKKQQGKKRKKKAQAQVRKAKKELKQCRGGRS